ncbi:MAG: hypothetical protein J1E35_06180 [Lachnospiraceae bacterium]|nr:hypothetical protein [Lachnospiraceae bacterium]
MEKEKNIKPVVSVIVFAVLIFGGTVASLFSKKRLFSENENRMLAQMPKLSADTLFDGSFGADYETYLSDQFFARDTWITIKTYTELLIGKKDINGVYFGKDGYLIEKHSSMPEDKAIADRNAERVAEFVKRQLELLGEGHCKFLLVPGSIDVLQDKLPPFASDDSKPYFIETMEELVPEEIYVDLYELLLSHKDESIYYRTDHHWTTLGAYYAYAAWAESCGITPKALSEFTAEKFDDFYGTVHSRVNISVKPDTITLYYSGTPFTVEYDMANTLEGLYVKGHLDTKDKYSVFLDGNHALVKITGGEKNGKTLLVVKDSFAHSFVPFAAEHFETVYMIDLRYFSMSVSQFAEQYGITDVLVLYNRLNLEEDMNTYLFTK